MSQSVKYKVYDQIGRLYTIKSHLYELIRSKLKSRVVLRNKLFSEISMVLVLFNKF